MSTIAAQIFRQTVIAPLLIAGLFSALSVVGHASNLSRYREALGQVSHQQVTINAEVKAAIVRVKDRFPGAALAACAPTGSMKPTLDENYIAVLVDCSFSQLERGDIILTRLGSGARYAAVMHRIMDSTGMGSLQTKGDALKEADPSLTTTFNYLGKRVVAAIHLQTGAISWLLDDRFAQPSRLMAQR